MAKQAGAAEREVLDVAIIGAGPAGLTAALYAARAGLDCAMFEMLSPGGQCAQTEHLENYPGYTRSTSGFELSMDMYDQAASFGARTISEEVTAVDFTTEPNMLTTPFNTYFAKTVIVATGAKAAQLGLPREEELRGRGISYCATCDGNFFRGKDVAVIGGGNTAVADVIYLARICRKVYLVHRRDKLRATAIYHQRLAELDNVELCWDSVATEFLTENDERPRVSGLRIRNQKTDGVRDLAVSAVFIAVGTTPNTEFLGGALALDAGGYIIADGTGRTATADVFAAGDVRTKELRQVVTAVADGANCAESAANFLSA
ncbi:thioredoxin-disulfide reductase [Adlercreutzia muris]|uniref:thioredoxin-disulfide reductase n=1 Tax=Adlercreutzia muris TaxID=1796610 RepID=UPI001F56EBA2|nr:thioredoxin-disulfide reductase [Adlercreutzia muris]